MGNWNVLFFIRHCQSHFAFVSGSCRGRCSKFEGFFENFLQKGYHLVMHLSWFHMYYLGFTIAWVECAHIGFRLLKLILKSLKQIIEDLTQRRRTWLTSVRNTRVTWTGTLLFILFFWLYYLTHEHFVSDFLVLYLNNFFFHRQALLFNALLWSEARFTPIQGYSGWGNSFR